jgi:hypothetical protein
MIRNWADETQHSSINTCRNSSLVKNLWNWIQEKEKEKERELGERRKRGKGERFL